MTKSEALKKIGLPKQDSNPIRSGLSIVDERIIHWNIIELESIKRNIK